MTDGASVPLAALRAPANTRDNVLLPATLEAQIDQRWVVERTHAWLNDFGRIRRCTERRRACSPRIR